MRRIRVESVSKTYDDELVLDKLSLEIPAGQFFALLGPSGCGKTSLLRLIAGLETVDSGKIYLGDQDITNVPINKRKINTVFQQYALFPHLTVFENIAYGLKIHRETSKNIRSRVESVMHLVGLEGLGERTPDKLSGGQQQRVSLARSLVMEPKVLLLDEPLSNLDAKLRVSTRLEIRNLQQRLGITSVYVTHDQEEAMSLSDRVVIMHRGVIMQTGTPQEVYAYPVNRFVADFIGKANFLEGRIESLVSDDQALLDILGKMFQVSVDKGIFSKGDKVIVVVRPESATLEPKKPNTLSGTVREAMYLGSQMVYGVEAGKNMLTVEVANPQEHVVFKAGEEVTIAFQEKSLHILPYEETQ